ncbi:MAG: bestrophin family protein [Leadbetterella sp.]
MIQYNTRDWLQFIFRFHKSDTVRKLFPLILIICVYTALITFLEVEYFELSENSHVKNISVMHGMLGFVISLLLAYRTNTAYDRWWEGRKLWGSLVNNSRNLAIKLAFIVKDERDRSFFKKAIPGYASILAKHLGNDEVSLTLFEGLDLQIDHTKHRPNQVAKIIFLKIHDLYKQGKIDGFELQIINQEFQSFTDVCGACERIKNTPIPYSYSVFIKKFIFFYIMTLPFSYAFNLGYYSIPVVAFVFYVLASLELIAEEIEDPFGNDPNDLPTHKMAATIRKHIEEIM